MASPYEDISHCKTRSMWPVSRLFPSCVADGIRNLRSTENYERHYKLRRIYNFMRNDQAAICRKIEEAQSIAICPAWLTKMLTTYKNLWLPWTNILHYFSFSCFSCGNSFWVQIIAYSLVCARLRKFRDQFLSEMTTSEDFCCPTEGKNGARSRLTNDGRRHEWSNLGFVAQDFV